MSKRDDLILLIARKQYLHITDTSVQKFADDVLDLLKEEDDGRVE